MGSDTTRAQISDTQVRINICATRDISAWIRNKKSTRGYWKIAKQRVGYFDRLEQQHKNSTNFRFTQKQVYGQALQRTLWNGPDNGCCFRRRSGRVADSSPSNPDYFFRSALRNQTQRTKIHTIIVYSENPFTPFWNTSRGKPFGVFIHGFWRSFTCCFIRLRKNNRMAVPYWITILGTSPYIDLQLCCFSIFWRCFHFNYGIR